MISINLASSRKRIMKEPIDWRTSTGEQLMYQHILLPYDGSPLSDNALQVGMGLAKSESARITLMYVVSFHHLTVGGGSSVPGMKRWEQEYAENIRAQAKQMLEAARERVAAAGLACETLVVDNGAGPYQHIIDSANRLQCDLIVMASHGRRGLDGLLVGSQTIKVLSHSTIPVLVVR
jgi:nucleotide-binding universal stress UspA family protein